MKLLFVHQNFPGQFKHLAPALVRQGHEVRALHINGGGFPGMEAVAYKTTRGSTPNVHPWVIDQETKVIRGEACARAAYEMDQAGWRPDVIIGHPGWGEMLFLRDVWPEARQLHFLEFYYRSGLDVGFDPEFPSTGWQAQARVRAKNGAGVLNLLEMDAGYSPTAWQRSSFPEMFHDRIKVVHDGIDTDGLVPYASASLTLKERGVTLKTGMEVVTFINRNLEPYRGYHSFMRALPAMQKARPDAYFVIVGGDGVSYGAKPPEGKTWKEIFLEEVRGQLDMSRIFFVGYIPYKAFVTLMQISACHVYLTYPFVLSWSMLEAMSCGAALVGSRTAPVEEVITHGQNGMLVDFRDYQGIADQVSHILANPSAYQEMRRQARLTAISRYDLKRVCLPQQLQLVNSLLPAKGRG